MSLVIAPVVALLLMVAPSILSQSKSGEQEPQRPDVIKVNTALVTVPVIVTDRYGRFVTGLARRDFTLREDGAPQEVASFSSTEAPFNVALLIDTSRSTKRKLGAIRKAALDFIKQLQPDDRVLIVTFDEKVRFASNFTSDHKELERAIRAVESSFLTSLYDAIHRTVVEKLAPLAGRKAIVVLTDGVDTASKLATYESTLELVSSAGVISYAIQYETRNDGGPVMKPLAFPAAIPGFFASPFINGRPDQTQNPSSSSSRSKPSPAEEPSGGDTLRPVKASSVGPSAPNRPAATGVAQAPGRDRYLIAAEYLHSLATQSGARYIRAESIESTPYAFALIAEELRHQYTLAYYSTNEKRDGNYRTISVIVKRSDLSVRARQGYRAPKADSAEEGKSQERPTGNTKP